MKGMTINEHRVIDTQDASKSLRAEAGTHKVNLGPKGKTSGIK